MPAWSIFFLSRYLDLFNKSRKNLDDDKRTLIASSLCRSVEFVEVMLFNQNQDMGFWPFSDVVEEKMLGQIPFDKKIEFEEKNFRRTVFSCWQFKILANVPYQMVNDSAYSYFEFILSTYQRSASTVWKKN